MPLFAIHQRVKIISFGDLGAFAGNWGTIVGFDKKANWFPYEVRMDDGHVCDFSTDELSPLNESLEHPYHEC